MDSAEASPPSEDNGTAVQAIGEGAEALTPASAMMMVEQASQIGREAYSQADKVIGDAKTQLRDRAEVQVTQAADALDRLQRQTRALAQGRVDEAGSLVDYANEGADRLNDLAQHLRNGGFDSVVVDVKRFARRRPVVFLAGSALAGLVIGRLLRNEAVAAQARQGQMELPPDQPATGSAQIGRDPEPGTKPVSAAPTEDEGL